MWIYVSGHLGLTIMIIAAELSLQLVDKDLILRKGLLDNNDEGSGIFMPEKYMRLKH